MRETFIWQHRRNGLAAIAVLVCGLAGCTAAKPAGLRDPVSIDELPILWVKSGTYSRITRAVHLVVRDAAELARIPVAEVPVDWKTQMVLIVGLGPTPTNEVGVEIARVWREGSRIRVQERRIYPGTERSPGMEPASPWAIAVVSRSDLNVEGFVARMPKGTLGEHAGAR